MKYVIVGAVAGGASAAARLRRLDEQAEIVIFEKGEYISYANCGLPYYIGNVIKERNKLFVQTAAAFTNRFNVDVRISTEVTNIDTTGKKVIARNLITGETYTETYDKLVLSPGAEPIRPNLPGINTKGIFTLRNVNDTDYIKSYVTDKSIKRAVVIGAGFIGLEMAENLHELGIKITIVEKLEQVLAPVDYPIAALLQQQIRAKGVEMKLGVAVEGFSASGNGLQVHLGDDSTIDADIVILSIGVRPDTRLAEKAGLKIGVTKGIWVNKHLQTSDPDVYAVGDAIEYPHFLTGKPSLTFLAGPANKQGRIVANNIVFGNTQTYKGAIGTAIVKVFDMVAGSTGLAVKHLKAADVPHLVATIHGNSHAGYYPGANLMTIQLAFSPTDGRILGAQVVGKEGVDKRLDVIATLIGNGGTVEDLTEFEQAYAPPFSSAKDPVNMIGFVAENMLQKRVHMIGWEEALLHQNDVQLVDVRTEKEFSNGTIEGAVNIPLDEIRKRLWDFDNGRTIYIFCQQGLRGYLAQRILLQSGFANVVNIAGGYLLWNACMQERNHLQQSAEVTSC